MAGRVWRVLPLERFMLAILCRAVGARLGAGSWPRT